jgi:hypothetical protein
LGCIKDKDRYHADPGEFIDYVNSCSIFLTDSFHGAVFSILLEKPFIVFDRIGTSPQMGSRIDTLLNTFDLRTRKWELMPDGSDVFDVDYSHVMPILEAEREKALNYLKDSFGWQQGVQN